TGSRGAFVWPLPSVPALPLTGAVSRKTHRSFGTYNVDLHPPAPAIECRTGANGHTLVFTFSNNILSGSASVSSSLGPGHGSVSGTPITSGNTMTVNL